MTSESKSKTKVVFEPEPKPGPLKDFDVFALSLGMVLGAGIISYLPAAIQTGGSLLGVLFPVMVVVSLLYLMPYIFVASAVRMGGGTVSLAGAMGKPVVAGFVSMCFLLQPLALATYGISLSNYVQAGIPGVNGIAVAVVVITIFFILNLIGTDVMAKAQNIMLPILIVGLALFALFGLPHVKIDLIKAAFTSAGAPNGAGGVFVGCTTLMTCCISFYMMVFQGRNCKDARRQIPKAMFQTLATILVLYLLFGIVAIGVLPTDQLGNTLATVAKTIFPSWLYAIWMVVVPVLLVATTLNSLMSAMSMMISQVCKDGWLPQSWAKLNKRGTPTIPLCIIYALAVVPLVTGYDITTLVSNSNLISWFAEMMIFILLFQFPKKYSAAWKASRLHCPNGVFYFFLCTAMVIKTAMAYSAFLTLSVTKLAITLGGIAVFIIWAIFRDKSGKAAVKVSCWDGTGEKTSE